MAEDVLGGVFELCAFAPSSRNRQPCSFVTIRRAELLGELAAVRGESSAPIGRAPLAVAVIVDTARAGRPADDGAITATCLLFAARAHGLGTCWIADMDRLAVRAALGIGETERIVMITPLGYPDEDPPIPPRRPPVVRVAPA
ncbi:MAG: nitroreductase family protein [Planctomycetes bacterium]|nr:nitroreductase family protein [Planctomycetota bacterium]